jgi:hypothetical protein
MIVHEKLWGHQYYAYHIHLWVVPLRDWLRPPEVKKRCALPHRLSTPRIYNGEDIIVRREATVNFL